MQLIERSFFVKPKKIHPQTTSQSNCATKSQLNNFQFIKFCDLLKWNWFSEINNWIKRKVNFPKCGLLRHSKFWSRLWLDLFLKFHAKLQIRLVTSNREYRNMRVCKFNYFIFLTFVIHFFLLRHFNFLIKNVVFCYLWMSLFDFETYVEGDCLWVTCLVATQK